MKVTILEGTPEEISHAFPHLNAPVSPISVVEPRPPTPSSSGQEARPHNARVHLYVSTAVARAALGRRELAEEQLTVLRALYSAHPGMVLATTLAQQVGYTRSQFAGLMGAFGRRVSHTEGYDGDAWFFEQQWNRGAGCYEYGLPETVREAMRLEQLV